MFELDIKLIAFATAILGLFVAYLRFKATQKPTKVEEPKVEEPKLSTGLQVIAKKPTLWGTPHPFYDFMHQHPFCVVSGAEQSLEYNLKWNEFTFVPLKSEKPYYITFQVTNTLSPVGEPGGKAILRDVVLPAGQQKRLKYTPPTHFVGSEGLISFL